jgi:adhesin transport system outer membrane protein
MRFQWYKLGSLITILLIGACSTKPPLTDVELATSVAEMTRTNVMAPTAEAKPSIRPGNISPASLRQVISSNERFAAAVARYRAARANVTVASSAQRPQVTGSVSSGGFVSNSDTSSNSGLGAGANVSLVQLIYDGGETAALVDVASARAFGAKAEIAVTGNTIGRDAAIAWIDVWQYNARLSLLNTRIANLQPWISRIEQLISSSIENRSVLKAAERQILDIKLEEESLQAAQRSAQERFKQYFGFMPNQVPAPPNIFTQSEIMAMRPAWQESPALVAAAAELVAAENELAAATARQRPKVVFRTGLDAPLSQEDPQTITAGVVVEHSFFDGGRLSALAEAREEELQSLRGDFEDTKSTGQSSIEASLAQYRSINSSLSLIREQIQVTRSERESIENELGTGQSNIQQFVEAEIRNYRAEARRLQLIAEQRTIEIELGALTGRLMEKLNLDIEGLL